MQKYFIPNYYFNDKFIINWKFYLKHNRSTFDKRFDRDIFEFRFKYQHDKKNNEGYYIIWTAGYNPGRTLID